MLFTTYNQMQTVKGATTPRQAALRGLAPKAILILDEAHNAGGTEANANPDPNKPVALCFRARSRQCSKGRLLLLRDLRQAPLRHGPLFKDGHGERPSISRPTWRRRWRTGGMPMQQVVASMLAEAGQYIRRERSFAGVTYDAKVVPVDRKTYNDFSKSIATIHKFSEPIKGRIKTLATRSRKTRSTSRRTARRAAPARLDELHVDHAQPRQPAFARDEGRSPPRKWRSRL
jgi:hypothetical protein